MDITKEQLDELILSIKEEYAALAKAEEEFPPKKEDSKEASPADESKKEDKEKSEASDKEKSDMKKDDAMAKDAPPEAAPEAPAEDAPAEEPAQEEELGPDDLFGMYMQLSEEHLAMHYMAASKALFSKMNEPEAPAEEGAPPEAEAAPADAPPPAAPEEKKEAPPAFGKSNKEQDELFKSMVSENANLKGHVTALEAKLDEVVGTLAKVTSQPNRKAFGSDNFNAPTEVKEKVLTKSDVMKQLNEKARDPNLTAAEREDLMKFSMKPVLSDELKKFLEKK